MADKNVRFAELLTLHINNTIKKKFVNLPLTPQTLREIRDCVRTTVNDVFVRSTHKLTQESINWIANQVFKQIRLNEEATVNDLVVINEYKLADLPYHDIELMKNLFNETLLAEQLEEEYQRRSVS